MNKSPYQVFKEWLLDGDAHSDIPEVCLSVLNKRTALCMFGNLGGITIYLNKYFNTYEMMKLSDLDFYKFLKSIVIDKKVNRYEFSFYKHEKEDTSTKKLQEKLPTLKTYEIEFLLDAASNDAEYEGFKEALGIAEIETIKRKKTSVKKSKKDQPKVQITDEKMVELSAEIFNGKIDSENMKFEVWLDFFGKKIRHDNNVAYQEST
jgi:hypothetical protein